MKSATSTLQQQLSMQPGIYMTEPKEPNFFSNDEIYSKGLGWYSSLYARAEGTELLGEASTHYTKLPTYPLTVERLKVHVPNARFIYVMRQPVDRLVSHYMHEWSLGNYKCGISEAIEKYPELVSYGRYTLQLKPYFQIFGKDAVLPVFFDRLLVSPQEELERICEFIGYTDQPFWDHSIGTVNESSKRIKRFPFSGLLIDSPLAIYLRRGFIPKSWRTSVKRRLTMRIRPDLSIMTKSKLEKIFDSDLEQLGEWLGIKISCSNFRELTQSRSLDWSGGK